MITPPSLPPACQGFEYSVALTTAVLTQRHLRIQSAQRHSARSDSLVFQRRMELRGAIENHLLDGAGFGEDHHNQPWVNSQRHLLMPTARRRAHTRLPILEMNGPGGGSLETQASRPGCGTSKQALALLDLRELHNGHLVS